MPKPSTVMEMIRELTFQNPGRRIVVRHPSIGDVTIQNIKAVECVLDDPDEDEDEIEAGTTSGETVEKIVVIEVE